MGVPSFFRWMIHKYPKTVVAALEAEEKINEITGEPIVPNLDEPNPNGFEFDNLYLDMNGLVHPCCHSCDPLPESEEEMMLRIFAMLDEVIAIVRPRKVLYLALDGTAPRAKMNQQRARRFKSASEAQNNRKMEEELRKRFEAAGLDRGERKKAWDQNVITPGTKFMEKLSIALEYWVMERMNSDAYYQKLAIVFSDSNVPGEGEHKIMNYIRSCRTQRDYDHNTRHCVYGLDADLVMLALTTHEPYFSVIRDHINPRDPNTKGRDKATCPLGYSNYDFLHCNIVREYLEADLHHLQHRALPMPYDFERCIDDFVFICFFSGNDFLPCLPSLEIREGGLDILIDFYSYHLEDLGGYITDHGEVNMQRLATLLEVIGNKEDTIFKVRATRNEKRMSRLKRVITNERRIRESTLQKLKEDVKKGWVEGDAKEVFKEIMRLEKEIVNDVQGKVEDSIEFGKEGWKDRYYKSKFSMAYGDNFRNGQVDAAYHYLVGVQWVMRYYFQGTASWKWYYPYHYPPFASDLCTMARSFQSPPVFEIGKPFSPVTQLMGVMPPESRAALPRAAHWYMLDKQSPIIDMYPDEIKVDYEGKRFQWMGVVLLPFIDENGLEAAALKVEAKLDRDEARRNSLGIEKVYAHMSTELGARFVAVYEGNGMEEDEEFVRGTEVADLVKTRYKHNMYKSNRDNPTRYSVRGTDLIGCVTPLSNPPPTHATYTTSYIELQAEVDPIEDNQVITARYLLPEFYPHSSNLLADCVIPPSELTDEDKVLVGSKQVFSFVGDNPDPDARQEPRHVRLAETNEQQNSGNGNYNTPSSGKKGGKSFKGGGKGGPPSNGGKGRGKKGDKGGFNYTPQPITPRIPGKGGNFGSRSAAQPLRRLISHHIGKGTLPTSQFHPASLPSRSAKVVLTSLLTSTRTIWRTLGDI
eukprot:TRINITY_DN4266_c1_g1_i1.p1 TRINITY_DN4266_c1_g1~~TRINITY_DN4266_c1_g1_i1.p1  ORF type:complete len:922 (+),score=164.52 TRINITY_DN4266_c1_g1_i1:72-2837(+)